MPLHDPIFADPSRPHIPLYLIDADHHADWLASQDGLTQNWAATLDWEAGLGAVLLVPSADGTPAFAAIGLGSESARKRKRFGAVAHIKQLPNATYKLYGDVDAEIAEEFALGWALEQYHFDRYITPAVVQQHLICPDTISQIRVEAIATGEALTRDLINTPSSDMGPAELETVTRGLAGVYDAKISVVQGDNLLDENLPMIHAVGRASTRAPRLLDMTWGTSGPKLTLVGKGVCFDTGGLNLKPGSSMGLMKKDMGGAAHVLGLAQMIMASDLPVQLRVLIPAVENSVSGNAFRPQDVLTSRKGLTVEINNTDAEGRLVLADALALADETPPDVMICMATLTGAARVAVGPDIAPYFTDRDDLSNALVEASHNAKDPVWRLPFHEAYEAMIEPAIADLDNAPSGGFAGSITAALFLRRFVTDTPNFMHFDCYGWQPNAAPARPKGGVGQGTRALFDALPHMLGLNP